MISAGKLNKRVQFLRRETVPDSLGGHSENRVVLGSRWARVEVPKARDSQPAQQPAEIRTHVLVLRDVSVPCQAGDIAVFGGLEYVILDTRPDPENGVVYVDCRSDVP